MSFQYNQRVRSAFEERAQAVPCEGATAAPQGEVPVALPRAAGLLCRTVPGEGRHAYGTRRSRPSQVLAQDLLTERGNSYLLCRPLRLSNKNRIMSIARL